MGGGGHHEHMLADFRRRFFVSLLLSVPIALLSPMLQSLLGLEALGGFSGHLLVLFALSAAVYLYGGWPFLTGLVGELRQRRPGMMTLIGLAITIAFVYSSLVAFGLRGKVFFWELASLIDLMLLGHWIEMRSVMGASRALEDLAELLPKQAHRLRDDGSTEDVPVSELAEGDRVLVRSGEKIPVDGRVQALDGVIARHQRGVFVQADIQLHHAALAVTPGADRRLIRDAPAIALTVARDLIPLREAPQRDLREPGILVAEHLLRPALQV
jgi:cation transport ATPase